MVPPPEQKEEAKSKGHSPESVEGPENEWKFKAPYKIHKDDDQFDVKLEAHCHCGKVHYQLSREKPLDAKYCHCGTCQRLHGACFQWAAIFHKEDINFTRGHHDLTWYDSQEKTTRHKLPCKVSCSYCHTPIMDEGRNMILLFPSLINFPDEEAKKKFAPTSHMFYGQRLLDIPDGKPKWTGISGESDLGWDSPKEAIEKREKAKKEEEEKKAKEEKDGGKDEKKDEDEKHKDKKQKPSL